MSHHARTSRPRDEKLGNEEASSVLSLGPEFTDVPTLSLSEARILISAITDAQRRTNKNFRENEVLQKTQDYLEVFARFKQQATVTQLESMLRNVPGLESYERSQLGMSLTPFFIGLILTTVSTATLLPSDPDEAKTLVPSIANKITDDAMREVCDQMDEMRRASEHD